MLATSNTGAVLLVAALSAGCTFYACPSNHCGEDAPAQGGSGQGGANGQSGGGGQAGSGGPEPTGSWVPVTGSLVDLESECGNMAYLSSKPDEDLLIAGVARNGLWASTDGGDSWTALGTGRKSATIINRATSILYDPDDTNTFWETGIYNGDGLYVTHDAGETFSSLGIAHNDYVSVDFGDPDRNTIVASGHEADHLLHLSTDGGETWHDISKNEPDGVGACSFPYVLDDKTFLLGCRSYSGSSGIYRSTNAGTSWKSVSSNGGAAAPLLAADGSLYFASDVNTGLTRTEDEGRTWSDLGAVGVVDWGVAPIQLPDGRLASVATRHVVISADEGESWRIVSTDIGYNPTGIVYSQYRKAFYVWHLTCDDTSVHIPEDGILRYDFDYESE